MESVGLNIIRCVCCFLSAQLCLQIIWFVPELWDGCSESPKHIKFSLDPLRRVNLTQINYWKHYNSGSWARTLFRIKGHYHYSSSKLQGKAGTRGNLLLGKFSLFCRQEYAENSPPLVLFQPFWLRTLHATPGSASPSNCFLYVGAADLLGWSDLGAPTLSQNNVITFATVSVNYGFVPQVYF